MASAEYYREWHQKNRVRRNLDKKNRKKRLFEEVALIKTSLGCKVCGYNKSHYALDFHHRSREDKADSVSRLASNGLRTKVLAEIEKCDVLCKNCHAEVHGAVV